MLTLKSLPLALGLCLLSGSVISSELNAPRTVIRDNENISVTARFPNGETGDLYLATVLDGKVMFITPNGLTERTEPKHRSQYFEGHYPLLDTPASALTPGVYPLYQVLTRTDGNPYNQADWIGNIAQMNFTVKMPDDVGRDYNRDGFPDDDVNHTGFHDEGIKTGNTTTNTTPTTSTTGTSSTGQSLFNNNCSSCHGTPGSISSAANANQTRDAITRNKGGMGTLQWMSNAELAEIASYVQSSLGQPVNNGTNSTSSESRNEGKNEVENDHENDRENDHENDNEHSTTKPVTPVVNVPVINTPPAPVVTTPEPVVTPPAPVVTTPEPVVTPPAPVVTTPEPVVTPPAPVVAAPEPVVVTPPAPVVTAPVSNTAAGQSLFNTSCSGCHGSPAGIRSAASATLTRSAINSNKGGMGMLKGMSDADLAAIASYVQSAP
ncbi:MAG: cytochrome c [Thiotrichaceae bacterium]|nr:cytochrome c [Thiotrichaceae bacterium]